MPLARFDSRGRLAGVFPKLEEIDGFLSGFVPLDDGGVLIELGRLLPDGSLDRTFAPPAGSLAMVYRDGRCLFRRNTGPGIADQHYQLVRITADGSDDATFRPLDTTEFPFQAWQHVGDSVLLRFGDLSNSRLMRLGADGSIDPTFRASEPSDPFYPLQILLTPEGKIYVVEAAKSGTTDFRQMRLVRLRPDGSPDESFTPFYPDRG